MRYPIVFFALDADAFARRLRQDRSRLMKESEENMKVAEDPYDDDQIAVCLRLAERICRNEIPKPYDAEEDEDAEDLAIDYFIALAEMANVDGEMIVLESLLAGRSWDAFFGEVGIWPLLQQAQPSFPVPTSTFFPPGVGFLPWETFHGKTESDVDQLLKEHSPPPQNRHWLWGGGSSELAEINAARIEFSEMVVSVAKDKLDLLAIAMT
jgi:hypothetical protein